MSAKYLTADGVTLKPGDTFYEARRYVAKVRACRLGTGRVVWEDQIPIVNGSWATASRSFSTWALARDFLVNERRESTASAQRGIRLAHAQIKRDTKAIAALEAMIPPPPGPLFAGKAVSA